MRTIKTLGTAFAVTLMLVIGLDYAASAATGRPFLLGRFNEAGKATTVKRTTAGPVLNLVTKSSGAAPMKVNGSGKVAHLNADSIDGLDSAQLRTRSYSWRSGFGDRTEVAFELPLPVGYYLVSYSNQFAGVGISSLECAIVESGPSLGDRFTGRSAIYNGDTTFTPSLTGSGFVTKEAGGHVTVHCATNGHPFHTSATTPFEIVATRTTPVPTGSLQPLQLN